MNKAQLIYSLDGINADDGVDLFEIAPVLMHFGELIRSANDVLGLEQEIDVNIKPFAEGSWITEFILYGTAIEGLLHYFSTPEGRDLKLILELLGFGTPAILGVVGIIRRTKGRVNDFEINGEKVTYSSEKGDQIHTNINVHKLVQSSSIQYNFYNGIIQPLDKFPNAEAVTVKMNENDGQEQKFTDVDKPFFKEYYDSSLDGDIIEETSTPMNDVYLNPKRGSYSGTERSYSFHAGETVLWPVTIEDEAFLRKLRSGEIRLYAEDLLRVNMELRQRKDSAQKVISSYAITEVIEYNQHKEPEQFELITEPEPEEEKL